MPSGPPESSTGAFRADDALSRAKAPDSLTSVMPKAPPALAAVTRTSAASALARRPAAPSAPLVSPTTVSNVPITTYDAPPPEGAKKAPAPAPAPPAAPRRDWRLILGVGAAMFVVGFAFRRHA